MLTPEGIEEMRDKLILKQSDMDEINEHAEKQHHEIQKLRHIADGADRYRQLLYRLDGTAELPRELKEHISRMIETIDDQYGDALDTYIEERDAAEADEYED